MYLVALDRLLVGAGAGIVSAIDNAPLDHDRSAADAGLGMRFLGVYFVSAKNPLFAAFTDISHGVVHGGLLKSKRTCANRTYFSHFVDFHPFLLSP
jgi:hypothetical protein